MTEKGRLREQLASFPFHVQVMTLSEYREFRGTRNPFAFRDLMREKQIAPLRYYEEQDIDIDIDIVHFAWGCPGCGLTSSSVINAGSQDLYCPNWDSGFCVGHWNLNISDEVLQLVH